MGFAIMRQDKIKTVSNANARLRHNRREVPCVTADRTKENKSLVSESSRAFKNKSFKEIFKSKVGDQKIRKNAVKAIEVILTFSPGSIKAEDLQSWSAASMKWLCQVFGSSNIIDARLHLDETTPHIHAMIIPIDERGKLNARAFLGGTRDRMVELQTSYAEAVKSFGLERGISKQITGEEHKSSLRWNAENAKKEKRLQTYEAVFGTEAEWDFDTHNEFIKKQLDLSSGGKNKPLEALEISEDKDLSR